MRQNQQLGCWQHIVLLHTHYFGLEQWGIYGFRKESKKKNSHREKPWFCREEAGTEIGRGRCHLEEDPGDPSAVWKWVFGEAQQHQTLAAGSSSSPWSTTSFCGLSLIYDHLTAPSPRGFQDSTEGGERWTYRGKPKSYASSLGWGAGNSRSPGGIVYFAHSVAEDLETENASPFYPSPLVPSASVACNSHCQFNPGERWHIKWMCHNCERTVTEMWTALSGGMPDLHLQC